MQKILRALVAVLLLGGAAAGVWLWRERQLEEPVTDLVMHGNVDIRQVELAFNGSERIAAMLVQEGEAVTEGQLLARLETERLTHGEEAAQARVEAQRQVLAALQAGTRPEEIQKARADVEAATVEAANAERNYERLVPLAAKNLASREQLDNAKTSAESARARLKAAQDARRRAGSSRPASWSPATWPHPSGRSTPWP